jgi:hypothetical protein
VGLGGWFWHGPCFVFGQFKFLCVKRKKIFESDLLDILIEVLILEVMGIDAGSNGRYYYGVRCGFSLVLEVPNPRGNGLTSNHEIVSVDRSLYSSSTAVVGVVMTIGIGGRTEVNGGAGSSFAMMISHGQRCSSTGR